MSKKLPTFSFRTLINNFGIIIKIKLGMDETAIQKDYVKYQQMQPDASVRDYMWSLFQRMILNGAGSETYRQMGLFVSRFEGGNGNHYIKLALKEDYELMKLQSSSESFIWGFSIISDPDCTHAKSYNNKWLSFYDFSEPPLANENCNRKCCRCSMTRIPKRDENGRLIRTEKAKKELEVIRKSLAVKPSVSLWCKIKSLLSSKI